MAETRDDGEAFFAVASELAGFHSDRSESVQQRAVGLLGFTGVLLSLVPLLLTVLEGARDVLRSVAVVFILLGIALMVASAGLSSATITIRSVRYPSTRAIRDLYDSDTATNADVRGQWAGSMLREAIPALQDEADSRVRTYKYAVFSLVAAIAFVAMTLVVATIGAS